MNKDRIKKRMGLTLTHLVLIAIGVLWIYPFLWMVSATFKTDSEFFANKLSLIPESPTFNNIIRVWEGANFDVYFFNTIAVTFVTVILVWTMTMLAGYVMGSYEFIGKKVIMGILIASITLPLVSTIIPTYQIIKGMGLVGTKAGLILASSGGGHIMFLLLFSGFFKGLPNELAEAARVDGANFFQIFFRIKMPLARPISITVIIMQSIWTWNAFLLPLVLTLSEPKSRTLAVGLYAFKGENTVDWTGIAAGGAISVIPIIILFIVLQKYFVDGIAGAVKS